MSSLWPQLFHGTERTLGKHQAAMQVLTAVSDIHKLCSLSLDRARRALHAGALVTLDPCCCKELGSDITWVEAHLLP